MRTTLWRTSDKYEMDGNRYAILFQYWQWAHVVRNIKAVTNSCRKNSFSLYVLVHTFVCMDSALYLHYSKSLQHITCISQARNISYCETFSPPSVS